MLRILEKKKEVSSQSRYLLPDELERNSRCGWIFAAFSVLLVVSIFTASFLTYKRSAQRYTEAQAYETMNEVSRQISKVIAIQIENCYKHLDLAQAMLSGFPGQEDGRASIADAMAVLHGLKLSAFDRSAIVLDDGSLVFSDNRVFDLSDEPLIQTLLGSGGKLAGAVENENFSDVMFFAEPLDNPLSVGEKRIAGIVGIVPVSGLVALMETDIFGKRMTYVVISDEKGNVILQTAAQKSFGSNLVDTFSSFADKDTVNQLRADLENGTGNTLDIMGTTKKFMTYYIPVVSGESHFSGDSYSVNNWRLLVLSRTDVLTQNISGLFQESRGILYLILLLFSLALYGLVFLFVHSRNNELRLTCVDPLTGLLCDERFKQDANLLISRGASYAVVSYNILRFKSINSRIGHEKADALLKTVGAEVKNFLLSNETASRSFADRFTVLLRMDTGIGTDRIRKLEWRLMSADYPEEIKLNFTIGVYMLTEEDRDVSVAMDRSRLAQSMTRGGHNVISNIVVYDLDMEEKQREESRLADKAESALENGHFLVYYQLKRDILNNTWGGCEALVRWKDPDLGFIGPGRFIPVFERNGFVVKLDKYVFEMVCRDLCDCIRLGIQPVPVSINLSRCHFEEEGFPGDYEEILKKYDLPHSLIEFEVTETIASNNVTKMMELIEWVHSIGCRCSLDDFGTGYSSLNMLQEFRFDTIKLDRSFFYGARGFDRDSRQIVKTLVSLSHDLGKTVVSEGIEDKERADFLKSNQCDMIQGYYYAKPVPAEECRNILKNG